MKCAGEKSFYICKPFNPQAWTIFFHIDSAFFVAKASAKNGPGLIITISNDNCNIDDIFRRGKVSHNKAVHFFVSTSLYEVDSKRRKFYE